MTFSRLLSVLSVLAALLFAQMAAAQAPSGHPAMPEISHVALTGETIKSFIGSMPAMMSFMEKHKSNQPPQIRPGETPDDAVLRYLAERGILNEGNALAKSNGFSSLKEWMDVSRSVIIAHEFSLQGKTRKQIEGEMQMALKKLKNDPNIPADQKGQFLQMITQQIEISKKMLPPEANVELVKQYKTQLDELSRRYAPKQRSRK